ncbi:hypothetical protein ES319_D08G284600v1 [Gossypium barbadense]|uniref:Uncharacterized protein n=1 Tax=Gossypium barbadense TaxID=3634 RepID=A0A5J5QJ99_GOSBA|nr:hypothetical protein ES319_D08G284600v1 [Gossypium barbadense]
MVIKKFHVQVFQLTCILGSISEQSLRCMASKIWPLNTKMQSRTCLCSPTKHPGSFKCSCHRHSNEPVSSGCRTVPVCAAFLNYRGLGSIKKTNFNTVNLLQMVNPSSRSRVDMQRIRNFQPEPSRG